VAWHFHPPTQSESAEHVVVQTPFTPPPIGSSTFGIHVPLAHSAERSHGAPTAPNVEVPPGGVPLGSLLLEHATRMVMVAAQGASRAKAAMLED